MYWSEFVYTENCFSCMFISGVPGTGKTATVMEVVATLQEMAEDDEISKFNLVHVNGMKLTHPHQTYVEMLKVC